MRSIRGLFWCPTCNMFVNRDRNTCDNIHAVYMSEQERPYALRFGQPSVKMKSFEFSIQRGMRDMT